MPSIAIREGMPGSRIIGSRIIGSRTIEAKQPWPNPAPGISWPYFRYFPHSSFNRPQRVGSVTKRRLNHRSMWHNMILIPTTPFPRSSPEIITVNQIRRNDKMPVYGVSRRNNCVNRPHTRCPAGLGHPRTVYYRQVVL